MVNDSRFSKMADGIADRARLSQARRVGVRSWVRAYQATSGWSLIRPLASDAITDLKGYPLSVEYSDFKPFATPPWVGEGLGDDGARHLITTFSGRVKELARRDPEVLLSLSGQVFEELMADVLREKGFEELSLRVRTELGEVDILGFARDLLGDRVGYIFELKQLGQSMRLVELSEVTRLYGLREGLRERLKVERGVFVTTTNYTLPARQAGRIYSLSLKAYDDLVEWLDSFVSADERP